MSLRRTTLKSSATPQRYGRKLRVPEPCPNLAEQDFASFPLLYSTAAEAGIPNSQVVTC